MLKIEFPSYHFKFKKAGDKEYIFDESRKKWVILTPEEWVRQNFLQYLLQVKNYPGSLIAVEKEIFLNSLKKRCDIIVYKNNIPWMIVECKEQGVKTDEQVLLQILRYNMAFPVEYLVLTNGETSFGWHRLNGTLAEMEELPGWK